MRKDGVSQPNNGLNNLETKYLWLIISDVQQAGGGRDRTGQGGW
jgi:hypothetical protein